MVQRADKRAEARRPLRPRAVRPEKGILEREELPLALAGLARANDQVPMLTADTARFLQRMVGNQAVCRLVDHARALAPLTVQRDEPETTESEPSEDEYAELDRLLDEVLGPEPQVPAFEAITSTTAGEYSRGELEQEIESLWRRERLSFTEAARRATETERESTGQPRSMASAPMATAEQFGLRWSLNLYAADYEDRADLPDVAHLAREGSPFRQAIQAEFDREIPVNNPTGSQMSSAIHGAIFDLWEALGTGQMGQLVVTFSGHGGRGCISGVDWEELTPPDLRNLAELAQEWNVHIIYILDTCRAGPMTGFAQAEAFYEAQQRVGQLPTEQREQAQAALDMARTLTRHSFDLRGVTLGVGDAARTYRDERNLANWRAVFDAMSQTFQAVSAFRALVDEPDHPWDLIGNHAELQPLPGQALMDILYAHGGGQRQINAALRSMAVLIDTLNDSLNALISRLQELTAGAGQQAEEEQQGG